MFMLTPPKTILVDLDDTLIDLGASSVYCWNTLAEKYAPEAGVSADGFKAAIHYAREWFWSDPDRHRTWRIQMDRAREEIVKLALIELNITRVQQIPRLFSRHYDVMLFEKMQLFPGAIETLKDWRTRGIRLALVTNGAGPMQRRKISAFKLEPYFDCIFIEGELGYGKPDERVYHHAMSQLGSTPAETWMVGDRLDWEVGMPQSLGMRGIWVDLCGGGVPVGNAIKPDHIVRNISELSALISFD